MLKTLRYQYLSILWAIFVVVICEAPTSDVSKAGFNRIFILWQDQITVELQLPPADDPENFTRHPDIGWGY